jgi:hypothetical protein
VSDVLIKFHSSVLGFRYEVSVKSLHSLLPLTFFSHVIIFNDSILVKSRGLVVLVSKWVSREHLASLSNDKVLIKSHEVRLHEHAAEHVSSFNHCL